MAVEAVFWSDATDPASKAGLLDSLRLDADRLDSMQGVIDAQIQDVRLGLYHRLGEARITEILLTAYAENPVTSADRTRLLANRTEATWLRLNLMRVLPQLWMDDSSERDVAWNEDAFSRERIESARAIKALDAQLEEGLALLADGDLGATDQAGFRIQTVSPTYTFYAGQTILPATETPALSQELRVR